jgi:hypothetical protein
MEETEDSKTKIEQLLFECDKTASEIKEALIDVDSDRELYWFLFYKNCLLSTPKCKAAILQEKWEMLRRLTIECPCSRELFDIDIASQKSLNVSIKKIVDDLDQLRHALSTKTPKTDQSHEKYLESILEDLKEFLKIIKSYDFSAYDHYFSGYNSKNFCLYGFIRFHLKLFGLESQSLIDFEMDLCKMFD